MIVRLIWAWINNTQKKVCVLFLPIMHCPALHFKIGNCCFRFFLRIHGQGQTTGGIIQVGMTETKKYLTLQIRVVQMSCERVQIVRYNVI